MGHLKENEILDKVANALLYKLEIVYYIYSFYGWVWAGSSTAYFSDSSVFGSNPLESIFL